MTMTEKILANHSENASVKPGDNIWTRVDKLMTHDVCGPGTFGIFQKEFGPNAQVWDNERVVIIPDHYIFTSDARANRNVDILRCVQPDMGSISEGHWLYFIPVSRRPGGQGVGGCWRCPVGPRAQWSIPPVLGFAFSTTCINASPTKASVEC